MKLLHCLNCKDVVALTLELRHCSCERSCGLYTDMQNASYQGPSVILGMLNNEVTEIDYDKGVGKWFVIPVTARTITKVDLAQDMGHKEKT
jgi:hypothetical protein